MRRRSTVYSGSKPVPQRQAPPQSQPAAKPAPQPAKRFAWRRALLPAGITLLVFVAGGLWLSQPRSLPVPEVAAIVHPAMPVVPPQPSPTDPLEKLPPSVPSPRALPDAAQQAPEALAPRQPAART